MVNTRLSSKKSQTKVNNNASSPVGGLCGQPDATTFDKVIHEAMPLINRILEETIPESTSIAAKANKPAGGKSTTKKTTTKK